jgi:alpha-beta hydrolase superfamily lysophospholipase
MGCKHASLPRAGAVDVRMIACQLMNTKIQKESVEFVSLGVKLVANLFLLADPRPAPALIVCHGAGEFKENYDELCEFLAEAGIASLAVDMHGHGKSGGSPFNIVINEWVADVRAAIDFLSKNPAVDADSIGAFGLSSGGTAILEAALVDSRLKFLVPLDATVHNSMPLPLTWFLQTLLLAGRIKKRFTGKELRLSLTWMFSFMNLAADKEINKRIKADPRARAAFMAFPFPGGEESFFVDTINRVAGIKAPVMILWGEKDEIDSPKTGRKLFDTLTCKKQIHVVPGNGHMGHMDRNRQNVFALTRDWILENAGVATMNNLKFDAKKTAGIATPVAA